MSSTMNTFQDDIGRATKEDLLKASQVAVALIIWESQPHPIMLFVALLCPTIQVKTWLHNFENLTLL